MTNTPKVGDVLDNLGKETILDGPVRVLGFDVANLWGIEISRSAGDDSNRQRYYVCGPRELPMAETMEAIRELRIGVFTVKAAGRLTQPDEELRKQAKTKKQKDRLEKDLKIRDTRFSQILPILLSRPGDENSRRSAIEVIMDPETPKRIARRAAELGVAPSTLYRSLHLYWAFGGWKNALFPDYGRCGNPGQDKPQAKKLGREPDLVKAKKVPQIGCPLDDDGKDKLATGYRLIKVGHTVQSAFDITLAAFWSTHVIGKDGTRSSKLLPIQRRPTCAQFQRWGKKRNLGASVNQLSARCWSGETMHPPGRAMCLPRRRSVLQPAPPPNTPAPLPP